MRTALILLFLLAVAAVPGSIIPQQGVDAIRTATWKQRHPRLTPTLDALQLFDVYGSPWFAAVYVLLMISLVGCFIPRLRRSWRALTSAPPATPANLSRFTNRRAWLTDESVSSVIERTEDVLHARRFRLRRGETKSISAQRGYLHDAGNLLFHGSLLVVLAGFALNLLFGFRGTMTIVTGQGVSNSVSQYDEFNPGARFDSSAMRPFSFLVKSFHVNFIRSGSGVGTAKNFYADLVASVPGQPQRTERIAVNHPLTMNGNEIFLLGHGYAPHITIRDGQGNIAYSGTTVFLPERQDLTSYGVLKVPDAEPKQLGFEGEFYPTYGFTMRTGPFTAFPDARNPVISMLAYAGDLGMDRGTPQSVYSLEKRRMQLIRQPDGKAARVDLALGTTKVLPDGLGSVTFDGLQRFIRVQVSQAPGSAITLAGTVLGLLGLCGSLFVRPRRIWVRAHRTQGRTEVEVAGLALNSRGELAREVSDLAAMLQASRN